MPHIAAWTALVASAMAGSTQAYALSGNQLHELCTKGETACASYIMGSVDTLLPLASGICAPSSANYRQYKDIVARFLMDRPERRHQLAPLLILDAMREAFPC